MTRGGGTESEAGHYSKTSEMFRKVKSGALKLNCEFLNSDIQNFSGYCAQRES